MMQPVGLGILKKEFPQRVIDVGIAEQEALASAAGMAYMGAHPVVALYETFLNRAFDQLLMDVALHKAGVTIVLDRAGITGADGASHNGMWDIAMCNIVPGVELFAPRDEDTLRSSLRAACATDDHPTVLRYRKGSLPAPMPPLRSASDVDVLFEPDAGDVDALIVATGTLVPECLAAAQSLTDTGLRIRVVDPVRLLPIQPGLADLACGASLVMTVEDGLVDGGFGWALRDALAGTHVPVMCAGVPKAFLDHAERGEILADLRLDAPGLHARILDAIPTATR